MAGQTPGLLFNAQTTLLIMSDNMGFCVVVWFRGDVRMMDLWTETALAMERVAKRTGWPVRTLPVALELPISERQMQRRLNEMADRGFVHRVGQRGGWQLVEHWQETVFMYRKTWLMWTRSAYGRVVLESRQRQRTYWDRVDAQTRRWFETHPECKYEIIDVRSDGTTIRHMVHQIDIELRMGPGWWDRIRAGNPMDYSPFVAERYAMQIKDDPDALQGLPLRESTTEAVM